jgi:hypothetical protein
LAAPRRRNPSAGACASNAPPGAAMRSAVWCTLR